MRGKRIAGVCCVSWSYSIRRCTVRVVPPLPLLLLQTMSHGELATRKKTVLRTELKRALKRWNRSVLSLPKRFRNFFLCNAAILMSENSCGHTCLVCWPYWEPRIHPREYTWHGPLWLCVARAALVVIVALAELYMTQQLYASCVNERW
jgi:hypothetical protein